ncbi:MAG TPA: GtrA family protein [Solirubrobacteraceae bacterium]|jgi:putative flippase GtrA
MRRLATSMLTPDSGLLGQGVRFAIAGTVVALVYLITTTCLALVVPFQIALAGGFCLAICVHFSLQRLFVWGHRDSFALPLHHQAGRYLIVAGTQYAITAASTSLLPPVLGLPTEVVYLLTVLIVASSNFIVFRNGIFHSR